MVDLKARLGAAAEAGASANEALGVVFGTTHHAQEVKRLPLSQLVPWSDSDHSDQPFRPYAPQEMADMMDSLKEHGLHMPIVVRPVGGKYQILAGHNRTQAARNLGWTEIDALIKPASLSDAEAAAILVDTNFNQRPRILPSERAWGWKIKMDSVRHQGTSSHGGTKLRSDAQLGKDEGKGRSTIQRYISLTKLIRPLLDIVDGYQYDEAGEWILNPTKPLIPLTAAEKLVTLSERDQAYIAALFKAQKIAAITPPQATDLKNASDNAAGRDLSQNLIDRCLGMVKSNKQGAKSFSFKLSTDLFQVSKADTKKYMQDPKLQQLVAQTIESYISAQRGEE